MSTLVMKFGGSSLESPLSFSYCANIILRKSLKYKNIVVVISAMKGTTNDLIDLAFKVNPSPQPREYDMLLSVGERISMSLLAMALAKKKREAVSFTGSQTGIITCKSHSNAKIINVKPWRILPHLKAGKIVIIAGFQGVSEKGEITTLGRGGSDTTAVALGIALGACKVEFFKDVPGVFTEDPKRCKDSLLHSFLTYREASEIVEKGACILHKRSVSLAERNKMPLHVMSFKEAYLSKRQLGTLISSSEEFLPVSPIYEK